MADSNIAITAGTGTNVDTRTTTTAGDHRQVIVIGAPATDADVAPVDATTGLKVNLGTDNDVTVTSGAITETNSTAILADTANIDTATAAINAKLVSGTVIGDVNLGATDNAVLDAIQVATEATQTSLETSGGQLVNLGTNNDVTVTSGTITETNSTAILADTANMDTNLGTIAGAVSGTEMQVDVLTMPSTAVTNAGTFATQATLQTGSNAIGKLAANSGVDIGDVDVTSITNASINGPSEPTIDSYTHISINLTTGANQSLVAAPGASKQIWVYSVAYTCSAAGTVSFQDEDDTAVTGIMDHAANSGIAIPSTGNFAMPIWKLATNKALEVDVVTADIDGWLSYAIVSV